MELFDLTAPCGIDCFNCGLHEKNITKEVKSQLAAVQGIPPENITSCKGCRQQVCVIIPHCDTRACVTERGLDFCFQCEEFPCVKLCPCAEGSEKYPHNIKLYNLCRIQKVGLEKWTAEASEIRKRYFQGKFAIGTGPQL